MTAPSARGVIDLRRSAKGLASADQGKRSRSSSNRKRLRCQRWRSRSRPAPTQVWALLENRRGHPDYVLREWMLTQLVEGGFNQQQADVLIDELRMALGQ